MLRIWKWKFPHYLLVKKAENVAVVMSYWFLTLRLFWHALATVMAAVLFEFLKLGTMGGKANFIRTKC